MVSPSPWHFWLRVKTNTFSVHCTACTANAIGSKFEVNKFLRRILHVILRQIKYLIPQKICELSYFTLGKRGAKRMPFIPSNFNGLSINCLNSALFYFSLAIATFSLLLPFLYFIFGFIGFFPPFAVQQQHVSTKNYPIHYINTKQIYFIKDAITICFNCLTLYAGRSSESLPIPSMQRNVVFQKHILHHTHTKSILYQFSSLGIVQCIQEKYY